MEPSLPSVHKPLVLLVWFSVFSLGGHSQLVNDMQVKNAHSEVYTDFKFDNKPSIIHQFKFEVGAVHRECFYQYIREGSFFHITFIVLRGGDKKVFLTVVGPKQELTAQVTWNIDGSVHQRIIHEGIYEICFDNRIGAGHTKLIDVFMNIYKMEEWQEWGRGISEFENSSTTVMLSLNNLATHLMQSHTLQQIGKQFIGKDWYAVKASRDRVGTWSLYLCCFMVISAVAQICFIRHLFKVNNNPSKPRA